MHRSFLNSGVKSQLTEESVSGCLCLSPTHQLSETTGT